MIQQSKTPNIRCFWNPKTTIYEKVSEFTYRILRIWFMSARNMKTRCDFRPVALVQLSSVQLGPILVSGCRPIHDIDTVPSTYTDATKRVQRLSLGAAERSEGTGAQPQAVP